MTWLDRVRGAFPRLSIQPIFPALGRMDTNGPSHFATPFGAVERAHGSVRARHRDNPGFQVHAHLPFSIRLK